MAPQSCNYNIYTATDMSAGEPPTGWVLEETMYDAPADPVSWID
jgi:hypothetical protein